MNKIAKNIKEPIKRIVLWVYNLFVKLLPVSSKVILFECNLGRSYSGNPRAIYEEMVRQGLDKKYKCYFIFEDTETPIVGQAKKVKRKRLKYFYLFAKAGIWICDSRLPMYIVKPAETVFIQTWHGTPLKKLGLDMDDVYMAGETSIEDYKNNFSENTKTWDYLISQNNYSSEIFPRAFDYHKEILEIGYPRNDVLFREDNEEDIRRIKRQMGLPLDKGIILYAPTWRDNKYYDLGEYKFESSLDFQTLKEEFGDDIIILVKNHYLVVDHIDWGRYEGFVRSFDTNQDISDLYLVSDILITDYSSVMFDYSILRRPIIFYCYDLEEYKDSLRGFYFDFVEEAPGPIVKTTEELIEVLKNYQVKLYEEKYYKFVEKYNHLDDGNASSKVVELIETLVNSKEE